jgi:hypothetical protein
MEDGCENLPDYEDGDFHSVEMERERRNPRSHSQRFIPLPLLFWPMEGTEEDRYRICNFSVTNRFCYWSTSSSTVYPAPSHPTVIQLSSLRGTFFFSFFFFFFFQKNEITFYTHQLLPSLNMF